MHIKTHIWTALSEGLNILNTWSKTMDFNIFEYAVLFQNVTLELHHSEHDNHLDSSRSCWWFFTLKFGICVKCALCLLMFAEGGHISVQRYMYMFVQVCAGCTYLKTISIHLLYNLYACELLPFECVGLIVPVYVPAYAQGVWPS